jgi:hypothetical protein
VGLLVAQNPADMFEYGTSRAAAWDCPVTVMEKTEAFKTHPRTDDILEVMRAGKMSGRRSG